MKGLFMLHTDRNNFGISQADGETDDYNTTRLANNANFQELDKNTAKCNWEATSDPTVNDDASLGYSEGSVWHNITSGKRFILKDATERVADWWQTYPPVGPIPAEADNLAKLGADGEIQDSGVNVADLALKVIPAADGNLAGLDLATGAIEDSGIDPSTLARRVAEPTAGHVAGIDADGDPIDSGETVEDLADAIIKKHAAAADDNFASLSEKTTPTGAMKVPVNDGTYGFMTRQSFLLGVKGGINFITNSDFEGDTVGQAPAGWGTYKDAAQATPEDGTGGSPSVTFLTSDTVILNGGKSARITKPASNCQGEGVNFLFNVPVAYRAGMVRIQLPYVPVDAIATGDFTIWIYDVTNGALIQPTAYQVEGRTAGTPGAVVAEFQAPYNMAQGRLLWHVATTSASPLRVDVDEIQVGPGLRVFGPVVTNWQTFTPTIDGLPCSANGGKWRRIGDTMQIMIHGIASGAANAVIYFYLPTGYSIDNNKTSRGSFQRLGLVMAHDASDNIKYMGGLEQYNTDDKFSVGGPNQTIWDATHPMTWASGDNIYVWVDVPILGWDACSQMSSDAETRVVAFRSNRNGSDQTNININASAIKLLFNSVVSPGFDTHGIFDISNSKYIIPIPGKYLITARIMLQSTNIINASRYTLLLYKNGVNVLEFDARYGVTSQLLSLNGNALIDCNAGDYVELYLYGDGNNSSNQLTMYGNSTLSYFMGERISGPSQIAASEKVVTRAYLSATQSGVNPNNSAVKINLNAVDKDTHGCFNTGTSKWICPRSGPYNVFFGINVGDTNILATRYLCMLYKNGSEGHRGQGLTLVAGTYNNLNGSGVLDLVAGDYLELYIFGSGNNSANTLNAFGGVVGGCYLHISSV